MQLPNEIATILLTDIEHSTRLWELYPAAMPAALKRHDELAAAHIAGAGGKLLKERGEGDSLFAVFSRAADAVDAAIHLQQALLQEFWEAPVSGTSDRGGQENPQDKVDSAALSKLSLRVRIALHTGKVHLRDGDYYGPTVNRCARIRAAAHGGQVLLSQSTAERVQDRLPDAATLVDLGSHRLRDLEQPERIYQLSYIGWPNRFPPLITLQSFTNNLPLQLTSFIGREAEIMEAREALNRTRLLTLTGSGGCGKTRLALQLAAELLEDYPDGVWLVELAALTAPEHVAKAIAATLRLQEQPDVDPISSLSEHLLKKKLLLVIDNCEHILEAAAQTVFALLRVCPDLKLLVTSRARLNINGENAWPVPTFPVPMANEKLAVGEALQIASVRLFAERGTAASPRFVLTDRNLPAVARICRRLDGIPLAIELAAARISVLTPEQIAKRLETSFRILTSGDKTVLERHQTLDAMIGWSYDLLSPHEQQLLRRLVVFAGGWTLEAAEQTCCGDGIEEEDVLELLSHLVDASLVIAEEREDSLRYRLLETVRQYGREKLEAAGESETAANRHLDYFLRLAEEAEPQLTGPDQREWLDRLDADHDNLRAALRWAVDPELRLRLAASLWRYWGACGHIIEGKVWLEGGLQNSHRVSDAVRAKALNGAGVLASRQHDFATAEAWLNQSLALREAQRDDYGVAEALNNLGNVCRLRQDWAHARTLYERSLEIRERVHDDWGLATSLSNLGVVLAELREVDAALELTRRSLVIYRNVGDMANIASSLINLGVLALNARDYKTALPLFEEAAAKSRAANNVWGLAIALNNLGRVHYFLENYLESTAFYLEGLAIRAKTDDMHGIGVLIAGIASVALKQNENERAACLFGASQAIIDQLGQELPSGMRKSVEDGILEVRNRLLPNEFSVHWQTGYHLSREHAVQYAMSGSIDTDHELQ
jgi:predicted ATPase/class 3 adenylate cyclase